MNKKDLRESVIFLRNSLDKKEVLYISRGICEEIMDLDLFNKSKNICLYMSINNEVVLDYIFEKCNNFKNFWLPKIINNNMDFYKYTNTTKLKTGKFNILEPESAEKLEPDENTLIIMPGSVFSEDKSRIGYGGGYYDKYLEKYPICHTVGVCYDFQVFPEIPTEDYDKKPEIVITDERIIY